MEVRVSVTAKNIQLLVDGIVDSPSVLIVVKAAAAIGGIIVDCSVIDARGVGRRQ